jgi:molecular chaperone GrpE
MLNKDKKSKIELGDLNKDLKESDRTEPNENVKKHKPSIEAEVVPDAMEQSGIVDALSNGTDQASHSDVSGSSDSPGETEGNKIIIDMNSIRKDVEQEMLESDAKIGKNTIPGVADGAETTEKANKAIGSIASPATAQDVEPPEKIAAERDEFKDKFLRKAAELENYIKRSRKEKEEIRELIVAEFILQLLSVTDNFERALAVKNSTSEQLLEGLKLTHQQLFDILKEYGLHAVPSSSGQPFDPQLHEAIFIEPTEEYPPNTVIEEYLKGYIYKDLILRPAKVRVAVAKESPGETGDVVSQPAAPPEQEEMEKKADDSEVEQNTENSEGQDSDNQDSNQQDTN